MADSSDLNHIESKSSNINLIIEEEHELSDSYCYPELERILAVEKNISKNIAFWNSLADSRLESTVTIFNLFILLLILSLASAKYNGPNPEGPKVLGWITCSMAILIYTIGPLIKMCYVPYLERQLKDSSSEGFRIYEKTHENETRLEHLPFKELILVEEVLENRNQFFRKCFPKVSSTQVLKKIKQIVGDKEVRLKAELQQLKDKENKAKWNQSFWQVYVVGKTFSIPSITMLVFIITPLSNATKAYSLSMNNAQGWLAVGFLAIPSLIFVLIKCCLWDHLNAQVKQARVQPFQVFSDVYIGHSQLRNLTLAKLEDLNSTIEERGDEFQKCFSEVDLNETKNQIKKVLKDKLPKKASEDEETKINEVVQRANKLKDTHAAWLNAFSTKIVGSIITIFKFLIVMALTFVENYPDTHEGLRGAQQAVGVLSLFCLGVGYLFYVVVGWCMLDSLQSEAKKGRSSPFTTFRLAYFGNKEYSDLEVHQLEDISNGIEARREQFAECFPKSTLAVVVKQIQQAISQKKKVSNHRQQIFELLKLENEARKKLQFWTTFSDGHIFPICYSFYVELVVILVTLTSGDAKASATMGWIGLGIICAFLWLLVFVKCYVLEYLNNNLKAARIEGYSEFNLVYLGKKELNSLELHELNLIEKEMNENPVQFKRCFPSINFQQILEDARRFSNIKKNEGQFLHPKDKFAYQTLLLKLNRAKDMLAFWSKLIRERLFPVMPISVVLQILWVQSIAVDTYGITVCGFLGTAIMAIAGLLILFFKLYLEDTLEQEIKETEVKVKHLERKRH